MARCQIAFLSLVVSAAADSDDFEKFGNHVEFMATLIQAVGGIIFVAALIGMCFCCFRAMRKHSGITLMTNAPRSNVGIVTSYPVQHSPASQPMIVPAQTPLVNTTYPVPQPYPTNPTPYPPTIAPYPPNTTPYPPTSAPYPPTSAPYPPTSAPYPPANDSEKNPPSYAEATHKYDKQQPYNPNF